MPNNSRENRSNRQKVMKKQDNTELKIKKEKLVKEQKLKK